MIKNRNIVIVGLQPWDIEIGSNCKNIALEFANSNRVLYVNAPMDRISFYFKRKDPKIKRRLAIRKDKGSELESISNSMWIYYPKVIVESSNAIPDGVLFDYINRYNSRSFAAEIKKVTEHLGFTDFLLFNDNSIYLGYYLKEYLKPSLYIYYIRDFLIKNPFWKKHAVRLEPGLIQKADLVVTNSTYYANYAKPINPNSFMVGQGCDVSLFSEVETIVTSAADVSKIPSPIIGYVGFLSSRRLDLELIWNIAISHPNWNIVLVGPEDDVFEKSKLHLLENVHFLGSKEGITLPSYIKAFDVTINPQLINESTMGNYPRKIDEYLAMGKPVVGSATEAMNYFSEVTYLASTSDEFIEQIAKALKEDNTSLQKVRRDVALSHSWVNNVNSIYECISNIENNIKTKDRPYVAK